MGGARYHSGYSWVSLRRAKLSGFTYMIRLAHLSDLHATPVGIEALSTLANKRFLGWLSWNLQRRFVHMPAVLEALLVDLPEQAPHHVAITGDLTNIALPREFEGACRWLRRQVWRCCHIHMEYVDN